MVMTVSSMPFFRQNAAMRLKYKLCPGLYLALIPGDVVKGAFILACYPVPIDKASARVTASRDFQDRWVIVFIGSALLAAYMVRDLAY